MDTLLVFDRTIATIGGVVLVLVGISLFLVLRRRRRGDANKQLAVSDRFNKLATKAGGRVVTERLIVGELKNGARSRAEAIERSIDRLDGDRRSWR